MRVSPRKIDKEFVEEELDQREETSFKLKWKKRDSQDRI